MPQGNPLAYLSAMAPRNDTLRRANFFEQAFAGPDDPRMDPQAVEQARRAALLQAGFAGLLAAGQGANPLETLGRAGLRGLEARLAINQAYEPPDLPDAPVTQVVEIVKDGKMHRVIVNKATGEEIADLGLSEIDSPELGTPIQVRTPRGDIVYAFPDKKRGVLRGLDGQILVGEPVVDPERGVVTHSEDDEGNVYSQFRDPTTGEPVGPAWRSESAAAKKAAKGDDEQDVNIATIERRVNEIDQIYRERGYKPFGLWDVTTEKWDLARGTLTSNEYKVAAPAQKFVATAVLKAVQGSRPSDFDMKMYLDFIIPRVGDSRDAIQAKIQRLREMIEDYKGAPSDAFGKTLNRARAEQGLPPKDDYFGDGKNRPPASADDYFDRLGQP